MHFYDFIQGLIIGSSLIIAIGPQNLYVINQGLKKTFVFTVVLFCSLSDSILIIIGINLSSAIVAINPNTIIILKILGGIWLTFYGLNKIRYVSKIRNLKNTDTAESDFKKILISLFLITYVNPHVYLDTIILISSCFLYFLVSLPNINFIFVLASNLSAGMLALIPCFVISYVALWKCNFIDK